MLRLSAAWVLACGLLFGTATASERPNIVLFFVDDLGWSNLGYRSPSLFETPNIDRLAREGVDFVRCYSPSPTCSPSRAALVTGKHPARLKIVRHITDNPRVAKTLYDDRGRPSHHLWLTDPAQFPSKNWLDLEHVTYAEALHELGYYNLFVGKWHLGPKAFHPVHQGFDRQIGTTDAGSPSSYYPDYFKDEAVFDDETEAYLTDKLTDETIRFIESYDRPGPFMISMWYYNVHSPNIGRKDLVPRFQGRPGLEDKRAEFAAQVAAVDESVGRIREALRRKGFDRNTVIVLTSDQGSLYEWPPLRGCKRSDTLCEGGARVPLLIYWPGVTRPGTQNAGIVQTLDLFPTFVEIAGGDPSRYPDLDGVSLVPALRENRVIERGKPVFGYRAYEDLYASVRDGRWKLLAYRSGKTALYDVEQDISEQHDVAARHPEIVERLVESLKAWEREMGVEAYSGVQ